MDEPHQTMSVSVSDEVVEAAPDMKLDTERGVREAHPPGKDEWGHDRYLPYCRRSRAILPGCTTYEYSNKGFMPHDDWEILCGPSVPPEE